MDKNLRLQVILAALDKATRPLKSIEGQSNKTGRALKASRDQLKILDAAQRDVASYRGLKAAQVANAKALQEAQTAAQKLAQAHASTAEPTRKMTTELARAKKRVQELKAEQAEHAAKLAQVRTRLDQAGISTRNLGKDEAHLRESIRRTNAQIEEQKKKLQQLGDVQRRQAQARAGAERTDAFAGRAAAGGAVAVAAGAGLAAPLVLASREAMKFEDAMADVRKVVDFPTPASFSAFSKDLLDMSTRIPVAADGLGQIAALGARAGVPLKDLSAFTEAAAKMGVAFDLSAEEAGAMMATWRAAFGMGQEDVTRLANQVNELTNRFGGAPAAVSEIITRIGPLGDVAGISAGEIAALAQVMNSVGVESEIGATGIKNMALALTKGEAATKAQKKAFAALGLDHAKIARDMQTDADGTITRVLESIAKLPEAQRAGVLTQLFGSESVAAIAPLLTQLDKLKRNFEAVGDAQFYAGSMDREYAARAATTSNAIQLAKNNAAALGVEVGTVLLPAIQEGAKRVGYLAQNIRDFAAANPVATKVVGALVAVLAGGLLVFGGLALAAAAVAAPFALMQFAWAALIPIMAPLWAGITAAAGAVWAFTAALLANPITWIVLAIAAFAAAAFLIWRNWGPIASFFSGLWDRVVGIVQAALPRIGQAILSFSPVGLFIQAFAALWPHLQALGEKFAEIGRNLIAGLIRGVLSKLGELKSTIQSTASNAAKWFRDKMGIHSPSRVFAEYGGHTMAGLALGIDRARQEPLDALGKVGAAMTGALALTTGAPALAASGGGGDGGANVTNHYHVTIHAGAGADGRQLARDFMREIEDAQASRRRGSFEDDFE